MNSVGIDTFLKATQSAQKANPSTRPESGGEFDGYLREAAVSQQRQSVNEQPPAKQRSSDAPVQPTQQDRGSANSANSSDEQQNPSVGTSEQAEESADEQSTEMAVADEILLSAAAIAESAAVATPAAEVTEVVEVPDQATEVAVVAESTEPTPPPTAQAPDDTQDFLPKLEEALTQSDNAPVDGETAATKDSTVAVETTTGDDVTVPVPPKQTTSEIAPTPFDQQTESQLKSEQAVEVSIAPVKQVAVTTAAPPVKAQPKQVTAETKLKKEGEGEKPETTEPTTSKLTAAEKHALAEQLVADVATKVTDAEPNHETKHKTAADVATSSVSQTNAQTQQSAQSPDATQSNAQSPNGDQDSRMPTIDRTRFVQRVANAFRSAQQNDGQIQMRLSPPELGSLRIEIAVRHGVLTANLETETADARRVLLDNLPALRQRLAEQDIRIEKFDVDVRRDGHQSDGQAGAQDRQAQQQSQRAAAQNRIRTSPPAEVISARVNRQISTSVDVNLDVRV